ncbi:hypothetical protein Bca101_056692 [Brassica carinata]
MKKRTIYSWGAAIVIFLVLMIVTPTISQSQAYHDFADQRSFFGIPNALNVVSNFPFLIIGLLCLVLCYYPDYFRFRHVTISSPHPRVREKVGWTCFFVGVTAVAFGSSYYHLHPDDARLVWDRLPMTIAFTSIMAIFVIERIDEHKGTYSIVPLLLAGIVSILYWRQVLNDKPNDTVQITILRVEMFVLCIVIPLMAILLPPMYTHSTYWIWAAGFYVLAKVEEAADKPIYSWTHHILSGHSIKHLCAAMVPVFLTLMLAKRTVQTERISLYKTWKRSRGKGSEEENFECTYSKVAVQETRYSRIGGRGWSSAIGNSLIASSGLQLHLTSHNLRLLRQRKPRSPAEDSRAARRKHRPCHSPRVLPYSEQLKYIISFVQKEKEEVYTLQKRFEHFCIHAGGRAIIEGVEKHLKLDREDGEASRWASSSVWYELQYLEAKVLTGNAFLRLVRKRGMLGLIESICILSVEMLLVRLRNDSTATLELTHGL